MSNPQNISIYNFTYTLPEEKIAKYPLVERDASQLLIYKNGEINKTIYQNIAESIPNNSLLIFNDTKVVEARLLFQKSTGGVIEIFCLEPQEQYSDITTAMMQREKVFWKCLVGGASKWKEGQILKKRIAHEGQEVILFAKYVEKINDSYIIELSWTPATLSFAEVLHITGAIPLPPYIKRAVEESDHQRYQTVYAQFDGSVAAPTAGLHFTDGIFNNFKEKNIQTDFVTLHVGAGTFKPVKSDIMRLHEMHAEWIDVSKTTIENISKQIDNAIIAVGTTSLRTLESLYWLGIKLAQAGNKETIEEPGKFLSLLQWEAYELNSKNISPNEALHNLLSWMNENKLERLIAKTQILIAPGYDFKIVNALITNFHQPQSTLLLLVAALIGDDWKRIYDFALQNDFRFLSYGDGSLLWKNETPVKI